MIIADHLYDMTWQQWRYMCEGITTSIAAVRAKNNCTLSPGPPVGPLAARSPSPPVRTVHTIHTLALTLILTLSLTLNPNPKSYPNIKLFNEARDYTQGRANLNIAIGQMAPLTITLTLIPKRYRNEHY